MGRDANKMRKWLGGVVSAGMMKSLNSDESLNHDQIHHTSPLWRQPISRFFLKGRRCFLRILLHVA